MSDNGLSVGDRILFASRNELYMSMPYMDEALCALRYVPGDDMTVTIATDGELLHYNSSYLSDRYMRSSRLTNRIYLHIVLHCMLRHLAKSRGRDHVLWDIACDAAVESIIDELPYACLNSKPNTARLKFYGECRAEMKVLTAEGIYRKLMRDRRSQYQLAQLQREFIADDHGLWDPDKNDEEQSERQDNNWKNMASKAQTGMETVLSKEANGGENILDQVRVAARDDVDYRAFLRRFAAHREIMKSDEDSFDYTYYTYGLQHYGNMPLIEPPETKEEKRIEDLVIAVDTSMSTSGELVHEFLQCTYAILRSTESFTRKLNIRILQCDDQVRSDTLIRSMAELQSYMYSVNLSGGSATDFRPVFEHVENLRRQGAFSSLRGLIYFTDGMGIYPAKRPPYDVAFVLLEEPPLSVKMPPWCIRMVLDLPALDRAAEQSKFDEIIAEEMLQEMPAL